MSIVLVAGVLFSESPATGDGIARLFHPNGAIAAEGPLKYGKNHGIHRTWHDNGQLKSETRYVFGMPIGISPSWERDGTLTCEHNYISESAVCGRVFDDLGKAHLVFLWNGKPTSKSRWIKKAVAEGSSLSDLEKRISFERDSHANEGNRQE